MKQEYNSILEMIKSPDKENVVLAYNILKSPVSPFNNKEQKQLLNKISIFDRGSCYKDICWELNEKELTILDFKLFSKKDRNKLLAFTQIKQLERFFNGAWIVNFKDKSQQKWYPYFEYKAGRGFVLVASGCCYAAFIGFAGFYKDEETSNFIGTNYSYIYENLL